TSYKRTLSDDNIEMSYFGSDSVMEKAMDYIKTNSTDIMKSVPYSDDLSYANTLAISVFNNLKTMDFDLAVEEDSLDKVKTEITDVEMLEYKTVDDKLQVLLGIMVNSDYSSGIFQANNKKVYNKLLIELEKPNRFYLNSAVNAIGDIYIDGGLNPTTSGGSEGDLSKYNYKVYIDGDINIYGTTPVNRSQAEQWYYGGLMVKNNAYLNVNGSAYCRSLIRTGDYDRSLSDVVIDKSRIDIEENVVTQGMHIFGREDKIMVKKDVYTLDDLEINGPDSVIAINGTYFGVSNGKDDNGNSTKYHDLSSAIVNSSTVHDLSADSKLSKKSRVVINGDVFINGGTFKLDNSGVVLGQIEDASVAWDNANDIEVYRGYDNYWTTLPDSYIFNSPPFDLVENKSYLEKYKDNAVGFGSLFQIWSDMSTDISGWLDNIDTMRDYSGTIPNNSLTVEKNKLISGYCKTAVAANDSLKFMDKINDSASGIIKFERLKKDNFPEQIEDLDGFWNDGYELKPWAEYSNIDFGIPAKLDELKKILIKGMRKNSAEFFIQRDKLGDGDVLNTQIQHYISASNDPSYNSYFDYILGSTATKSSGFSLVYDGTHSKLSEYGIDLNKYQIFLSDSTSEILVDTDFNGLIITRGRVRIARGVTIKGAIIAAGEGFDSTALTITSVDSANSDDLNNGAYSAVYFDYNEGVGDFSRIIFNNGTDLLGRVDLLNKILNSGGPDLKGIL
ncbi:MAG: hypothetical protein ABF289_13280, partial [Clostridiales bacterium]